MGAWTQRNRRLNRQWLRRILALLLGLLLFLEAGVVRAQDDRPMGNGAVEAQSDVIAEGDRLRQAALELYQEGSEESLNQAVEVGQQARELFRGAGDQEGEAFSLLDIGNTYRALGDIQQALEHYSQVLPLSRDFGDQCIEAVALNNIGFIYRALDENQQALSYYKQALPLSHAVTCQPEKVKILTNIGTVYSSLGDTQQALEYYNQALSLLRQALSLLRNLDSQRARVATLKYVAAVVLNNIGDVYRNLDDVQQALDYYNQSLPLFRAVGDRRGEARTLNNIGAVYRDLDENQQALDYYNQSLPLFRAVGDRRGETLIGNRDGEALVLGNIGNAYRALNENQLALYYLNQALSLYRDLGDRGGEANTLNNIGAVYTFLGNAQQALSYYITALPLLRTIGDRYVEARTLSNIGSIYSILNNVQQALDYNSQALLLHRAVGDRPGEARTLSNTGSVYNELGKLETALEQINSAIRIVEELRTKTGGEELRTSYFAAVEEYYQFKIDLLMQLEREEEAFATSERSRARTLIELLAESNIDPSQATDNPELKALYDRKEDLENQLAAYENLIHNARSEEAREQFRQESQQLELELENSVEPQIKQKDPAYVAIRYPTPLTLDQIQRTVLDDETVLLQYSLGTDRSYLWVVPKQGERHSYTLPPKAEIEQAVQDFRTSILEVPGNTTQDINRLGKALTQKILPAEAMPYLQGKRFAIAADGALQTLPFAALPDPTSTIDSEYVPLIAAHEIVNIPSATAIATHRQEIDRQQRQGNRNPPKVLAAIANPVFQAPNATSATESIQTSESAIPSTLEAINLQIQQRAAERSLEHFELPPTLDALPNTEKIADAILKLVPNANQTTKRVLYAANQDWVMQAPLNQYRYLFFGSHGFADNINPELSFIALSLFNEQGQPIDGYLRLNEIFNLKLAADVVVLNACRTGLGKDMRGEGIIGLTRGFMYAGAKSIVASLWDVSATDQTTKLMIDFFTKLLQDKGTTPAAALRSAQLELRKTYPNDPNYWAAFTIQGDWK